MMLKRMVLVLAAGCVAVLSACGSSGCHDLSDISKMCGDPPPVDSCDTACNSDDQSHLAIIADCIEKTGLCHDGTSDPDHGRFDQCVGADYPTLSVSCQEFIGH